MGLQRGQRGKREIKNIEKNKKRTLIFIPAYNHKKTIIPTIKRIPESIFQEASEILVADDASQDNTTEIVKKYIADNKKNKKDKNLKKLKVIKHEKNKGYGGNQKWAYQYAIANDFDIVVMLHGDSQYAPEKLPDLIEPIKNGKADFVFGSRMTGKPLAGGMPLYKFLGNKFLTFLENIVLKTKLSEFHSGYRAYSLSALREIPFHLNSSDFHFDSEIIAQLILAKKKISETPIPTFYGKEKSNVNSIRYGISILGMIVYYILHKTGIKKYYKFDLSNSYNNSLDAVHKSLGK